MPKIKVEAPAKLNLHLHIGPRRPDGFHEIESLFLALVYGDTLYVETVPRPLSLEIGMNWQIKPPPAESLPPDKNIITQAVSLFRNRTGCDEGLKITVEKRIPPGGGLGGGSSDAAAALLALNRLASPHGKGLLNDAELAAMGASLGSDVPFFLCRGISAAWVSGRGEKIQPLELPEPVNGLSFVLVNPGFPSDTTEAYRLLDLYRKGCPQRINHEPSRTITNGRKLSEQRVCGVSVVCGESLDNFLSTSPRDWPFFNDFLPVFQAESGRSSVFSEAGTSYQHIISCLREWGAGFAGLSGSGSTCFGVFSEQSKAETAKKFLLQHWPSVVTTFCLRAGQYHDTI